MTVASVRLSARRARHCYINKPEGRGKGGVTTTFTVGNISWQMSKSSYSPINCFTWLCLHFTNLMVKSLSPYSFTGFTFVTIFGFFHLRVISLKRLPFHYKCIFFHFVKRFILSNEWSTQLIQLVWSNFWYFRCYVPSKSDVLFFHGHFLWNDITLLQFFQWQYYFDWNKIVTMA